MYLASEYEYRRGLANRLLDENVIDFCLTDHLPWTESPKHDDRIVEIDHRPSHIAEYDEVCDINELPAVSKELMEKMLPYESMAIKIGMRRLDKPTTEYEEEKRKYLQHLRYWNYMFDKYNINLVVTHCIPHSQGMYVKYGLAKVRNIPFLLWHANGTFINRLSWGDSLESIGAEVGKKYLELCKYSIENVILDDDIERDYEIIKCPPRRTSRERYDKRIIKSNIKNIDKGYKNQKKTYIRKLVRSIIRSIVKTQSLRYYREKEYWFRMNKRHFIAYRYYKKHNELSVRDYNRIAVAPDYSKEYVLYLPQVTPEANTMPLAGVFAEQYNSIQLLARAAQREGLYVYVKEHPHCPGRSKDFYREIVGIKNVRLIKTNEMSYDLMKNSIGVATQTGTCTWEALVMGKPVFVFGSGYHWKKCPGVYEIEDEEQGSRVIRDVLSGKFVFSEKEIKRYLYAFQLESLKEVSQEEEYKRVFDDNYKIPPFDLTDRVELIKKFIRQNNIK